MKQNRAGGNQRTISRQNTERVIACEFDTLPTAAGFAFLVGAQEDKIGQDPSLGETT